MASMTNKLLGTTQAIIAITLLLAACQTPSEERLEDTAHQPAEETTYNWLGAYSDTLPCADCPGIIAELELRADSTYVLRERYLERDSVPYGTIGRWTVSGDRLSLHTTDRITQWQRQQHGLIGLDTEGRVIDSGLPYTLQRVDGFYSTLMHLTGGYVYYADSHSFTPCGSAFALPVAMDPPDEPGAGLELERTYMKLVKEDRKPLYVKVQATLLQAPAMEGEGTEEYLHIERLEQVLELQACQ